MSISEDSPPCEMCDGDRTHSTFDTKTHDWDMFCYDCGFHSSDTASEGSHEMSLVTTRHCKSCGVSITKWSVTSEGYLYECSNCDENEIRSSIDHFNGVTPEDRWDFLKDYRDVDATDWTYTWRPCEGGCEDYWYDNMTDAAKSCKSCTQLTEKSKIWKDWN
ncbi:MAG: hypothetical protein CMA72_09935 [Euryarchaeota archaeon]|nr:hypothetical protein [Euryarchaeota archaeon]